MILRNLRLIILLISCAIIQFIINNFTILYIDIIGIVVISLLLDGRSNWSKLVLVSLMADLMGHWYLGTHLLPLVILSIFSQKINRYFQLCNWLNRSLITVLYWFLFSVFIYMLDLLLSKTLISVYSLLFEFIIIIPILQIWLNIFAPKSTEYISYE